MNTKKAMNKQELEVVAYLMGDSLPRLRERLIEILAKHMDRDMTQVEAIAIRTVFDVGKWHLSQLYDILSKVKPK